MVGFSVAKTRAARKLATKERNGRNARPLDVVSFLSRAVSPTCRHHLSKGAASLLPCGDDPSFSLRAGRGPC